MLLRLLLLLIIEKQLWLLWLLWLKILVSSDKLKWKNFKLILNPYFYDCNTYFVKQSNLPNVSVLH